MTQTAKRILIVDDEAPLRFLLSKHLSRAGFEVETAADGPTALALAAGHLFHAVVLDVVMPGMDGFEVCRRLKANPWTDGIPVLFLSASCSGDFRRRAFSLGAADFLAKPFQTEQLPTYLHALLGDGPTEAAESARVTCVAGTHRRAGSVAAAVRLAEEQALRGGRPVMLIDLELPAGSIGAQLQLSGGPNVRLLLQDTGEAVTLDSVRRVSQRVHFGLEVIPSPFAPSPLGYDEPDTARLAEVIATLTTAGYALVLHLGSECDEVTLAAMRGADVVYAVDDQLTFEAWADERAAAGVARERLVRFDEASHRTGEDMATRPRSARPGFRSWSPVAQPEGAGQWVAA